MALVQTTGKLAIATGSNQPTYISMCDREMCIRDSRKEGQEMYQGRFFVRQTVYVCGDYMDADIYPVFQPAGKRRKKCRPTSKIQEKLNQKNAEKRITRLVHLNFTGKDIALHLTYTTPPESQEQAQRDLYNYIRRVKRARKKLGLPALKYISCTETGKKSGRVHHHLIPVSYTHLDVYKRQALGA